MTDETSETEEEIEVETESDVETDQADSAATLDVEAVDAYESRIEELQETVESREEVIEELQETVEEQQEQLSRLDGQFRDLSARVADGRNFGVCPDCNGPTEKKERLFRSDTIECNRCGKVIHTYG
ncbi:MAG: SlyX family protein [Salinirussus sp.]